MLVCARVTDDLVWLRKTCAKVDAAALRRQWPDVEKFRAALHEARAQTIAASLHERPRAEHTPAGEPRT